jgi:CheY-like chemotaxis protein
MKVLVVDDEPAVLRMVSTIFRREGAVVYPAGDGEEALEVFDEAPSSWELVVADYSMPGLDGQGLLRALRERGSPVPVLLSSGYQTDQMGALSGDGLEPLGFLAKPYRPADLVEQASELVHRATGEAAPQGVS